MGCGKDIVEHAGVPRLLFSDFPLGNACGRPFDEDSQRLTLELALQVLESAIGPRTTVQSPLQWSNDPSWKEDFSNVSKLSAQEIEKRRAAFDEQKQVALERRKEAGVVFADATRTA